MMVKACIECRLTARFVAPAGKRDKQEGFARRLEPQFSSDFIAGYVRQANIDEQN
ncbi:hypothetical protein YK56LOC_37390 [Caballeronia sp. HLA56]